MIGITTLDKPTNSVTRNETERIKMVGELLKMECFAISDQLFDEWFQHKDKFITIYLLILI